MRKVILPGETKPGTTILVPRGYEDVASRERIGVCLVCGLKFFKGQEETWQRHVGLCAQKHRQELHDASPRRIPVFDPERYDMEASEHIRTVGRRMREEGRLTMRKNERLSS